MPLSLQPYIFLLQTRVPRAGRTLSYHAPSCDLFLAGARYFGFILETESRVYTCVRACVRACVRTSMRASLRR